MRSASKTPLVMGIAVLLALGCARATGEEYGDGSSVGARGPLNGEPLEVQCGPDVIQLLADQDPEVASLSDAEIGSRWLSRVRCLAEGGEAESQLKLGIAYRDGSDGPPQDYSEAAIWLRRAAEQGNPMGMFNLAILYERGRGVPRDLVRSHMWYNLAAASFDVQDRTRATAFYRRDALESRMTPAEVRDAQQRAREWWAARDER